MCRNPFTRIARSVQGFALSVIALGGLATPAAAFQAPSCPGNGNWVTADVVALDQVFIYNRRGAFAPGMIYALARDVVADAAAPGGFRLRDDKRPRPLTLRVNQGDCLAINFTNLLANPRSPGSGVTPADPPWDNQPAERAASVHVIGMQLLDIASDGANVGRNASSVVLPGNSKTYYLYAEREGTNLLYSGGVQSGAEADGGGIAFGLFGAVNVEPRGSEWYRSQLTREEMDLATVGATPGGQPILNYDAVYPCGHARAAECLPGDADGLSDTPIIRMTAGGEIVHSDLTAVITGANRQHLCNGWDYPLNPALPDRCDPFREFTIIFHDEIKAVQAFDVYLDPVLIHTLHSVRDGFAINYGTGGIGSEILANRLGLGPEGQCNECKYEEFFLTSWAVGDPAMVTDVLANASDPATGNIATVALYPDDPSNVYHSYINDHVKIRNLHAGPKEHHIFHLHAHQWMYTPDSENSSYLDSQAVGPGSSYTYDIAYEGSGNRNKTPGDAIFHCHFYPHFAQGMWALWRNHDVLELGTALNLDGTPAPGARSLPDGEIAAGTPTPGIVPIPGFAMAPMPTLAMPGYPFYIPGVAGHRPPKPPLDTEVDGGLPRHVVHGGVAVAPPLNRMDFDKINEELEVEFLPETGTPLEVNAMNFHSVRNLASWTQPTDATAGVAASYVLNGLPGIHGAPFADPCVLDDGTAFDGKLFEYRAAGFRLQTAYNKVGWKNPQHHMEALNEDVGNFMSGAKPPEPFFFRANSNSCINFYLTNLFNNVYQLDDFQVRTPTDVLGQHIHLVKFDVTSSDGSANGFNYEDGSLAPDEVTERIAAIRVVNACLADDPDHPYLGGDPRDGIVDPVTGQIACPVAEEHPFFKDVPEVVATGLHLGAQTTIQRWFADSLINNSGDDRTLRTVYTHDHFAPSTQQQAGYYAGLLVEPEGSQWLIAEGPNAGKVMGGESCPAGAGNPCEGRGDGGPTSWQAIIEPPDGDAYREFMFEVQDFALAYNAAADNSPKEMVITDHFGNPLTVTGIFDVANVINPPAKAEIGLPFLTQVAPLCPGGVPRPCPEAVSADDPGTFLLNYRNEPIPFRVRDPLTNTQAPGLEGDLSHVFRSDLIRADARMNADPATWPVQPLTGGVLAGDPATPLFRTYEGDRVQIRTLVGAHEEGHNFTVHGIRWLFEPSWANSGLRGSQMYGISEHFEFDVPSMAPVKGGLGFEDYMYQGGAGVQNMWNGVWGMMRVYSELQGDDPGEDPIATLSTNPGGKSPKIENPRDFRGVCPAFGNRDERNRNYNISAVLAQDVLPGGQLVYNSRPGPATTGPLTDPNAILYVYDSDLETNGPNAGMLKAGLTPEPIVIRAAAGDCINVTLTNRLPVARADMPDAAGFSGMPLLVDQFQANQLEPSNHVGLHAQLVEYDMEKSDGANVGWNPVQTAAPGASIKYQWYAGQVVLCRNHAPAEYCTDDPTTTDVEGVTGWRVAVPTEFGATPLISSDRIKHSQKGAIGALIIEPEGSSWVADGFGVDNRGREVCLNDPDVPCSRTSATVTKADDSTFRDFALVFQDDLNLRCNGCGDAAVVLGAPAGSFADPNAVPNLADSEDPEDSGQRAFNYKTEPMWLRYGFAPDMPLELTRDIITAEQLSNTLVGGDPETPIFTVDVGTDVRFRVVHSGGHARNHVFTLHGHGWQTLPFTNNSTVLGNNPLSEWRSDQEGIGPTYGGNFLLTHGAGGAGGVVGDYLFRDFPSFQFDAGLWGLLRVCEAGSGGNTGDKNCLPDSSGSP